MADRYKKSQRMPMLALWLVVVAVLPVTGQESTATLTIPPEQQILRVEVTSPEEVRVGGSIEYQVTVTNLSDDMVVHNIVIEHVQQEMSQQNGTERQDGQQDRPQPPQQERPESEQAEQPQAQQQQQQQDRQQTGQAAQEPQPQQQEGQQQEGEQQEERQQQQHQRQNEPLRIEVLQPGESKQLTIQVAADQQGEMRHCFAVTSYTPALCVVTQITMADLELVKQAPETANICEDFEFAYFVKNTGTTDLENITVSDELPEGVHLVTGETSLEFEVDRLEVDEVRKFTVDVRATRSGTITSRATATFADDQQVRSREASTELVAPEVAVSIEGPRQVYLDDPMAFSIRVTNQGQAVAPHTRLQLEFPQQVRVFRVGEPYLSDQAARGQDGRTAGQQEPTPATPQEAQQQEGQQQEGEQQEGQEQDGQQDPAQRLQGMDNDQEYWTLGDLEPGQTVVVEVRLQAEEAVEIPLKATADFICALSEDREDTRVQTTALTEVRVITMSALLVTVIDTEDPVPVGGETSYVIRVRNQGEAPATQVQISINLPDGLEFRNAEGPTEPEGEGEGQTITFAPVETLDAGQRLEYRVHATASQPGDLRIHVELTSDDLSEPVISQESTRVYEN